MSAKDPTPAGSVTGVGKSSSGSVDSLHSGRTARKWMRFLRALIDRPHTTRELERAPVFDHCAHSTASEVRKKGVQIVTEVIEVPGYAGQPARIARYSIPDAGREFALQLLGRP